MKVWPVIKKWSKWLLLLIVICIVLLFIFLYIILATDRGFAFAKNISHSYWPSELTIEAVKGNPVDGLSINELNYHDESIKLTLTSASIDISLTQLFSQQLIINELTTKGLTLTLTPTPSSEPTQPFAGISAPIDIIIKQASINQATITTNDQQIIVDSLKAKASWIAETLTIDQLDIATGTIGQENRVPIIEQGAVTLSGSVKTSAELPLTINYQYDISLSQAIKKVNGAGFINGNNKKITLSDQSILFASNSKNGISTIPSTVTTEADINLEKSSIDLTTNIKGKQALLIEQQWLVIDDFALTLSGPFNQLAISTKGNMSSKMLNEKLTNTLIPNTQFTLNSLLTNEDLIINNLQLDTQAGSIVSEGTLTLESLKLTQNIMLSNINPGFWDSSLNGTLSGTLLTDLDFTNGLTVNTLKTNISGSVAKQDFQSDIDINGNNERLIIKNAIIAQGQNTLSAEGQLALTNNNLHDAKGKLVVKISAPTLNTLHPSIRGALNLDATITRQGNTLDIATTAQGKKMAVNDNAISEFTISGNGSANPQNWQSAQGKISLTAQQLNLAGQLFNTSKLHINGNATKHQLSLLVDGEQINTELKLSGELNDKQWRASINTHNLSTELDVDGSPQKMHWQLAKPAILTVGLNNSNKNTLSLSDACWLEAGSSANLCMDAKQQKAGNLQATLTLTKLPTTSLAPWLPTNLSTEGYLTGSAKWQAEQEQLTAQLQWLDGNIRVDQADPAYSANVDDAELSLQLKQSVLQSSLKLTLSDKTSVIGTLALAGLDSTNINNANITTGQLAISIPNTDYIAKLSPEISRIEGQVALNITASGKLTAPIIEGQANLGENGKLVLTRTNTVIGQPSITINPQGEQLALTGQATLGTGTLKVNGLIDLIQTRYSMKISGEQLELIDTEELQITANTDIDALIDKGAITLTGKANIPQAKIIIDSLPPSAITPSSDIVIVNQPVKQAPVNNSSMTIDLKVTLGDDVFFSALGLESHLAGSLKLTQTPRKSLFASGQIELVDGQYLFYGQQLNIEEGKLYFTGPIDNPRIVVKAVRDAKTVTAGVLLEGTPDQLESSLYSEPALAEGEILSYIITGKPLSSGGGSEDELAQAAILLGLKQTTGLLGSNDISIDSSDGTGNSTLTTGKQINDKLYLGYRYGIFSRTGAWLLKYALTESLQLESAYGENQTIDLIYGIKKP